ncbi:MAG: MarC family protein [Candidatus Omnitrophica bacterium]|jgi:multiple antibiotic resistance protein|nr:MarC family protein [Candidatus Omnitrophota bacterium]
MQTIFEPYLLSFIPIFVAVDAIGSVPIFVSLIDGVKGQKRRRIIIDAVTTATAMAVIFMIAGKYILRLLGITISDFQIAGGAFLFIIAVRLLFPGAEKKINLIGGDKDIGIFPLGTPLITGPAVLTTTLMMVDKYNVIPAFVALVLNMLIVWISLDRSEAIMNVIGPSGTRAFSKIMYILLGAIGVMMIRHGVEAMLLH